MKILVFNCGSSSLKYKVILMPDGRILAGGEAQRVGPKTSEPAKLFHRQQGKETVIETDMPNHKVAFDKVMAILTADLELTPDAVGHRVVHGADVFKDTAVITPESVKRLSALNDMAPLHNPPAVALIEACLEKYPGLPQTAVFDTAYHATIPDYAYTYPIPRSLARKLGIRKYGFHGTSHRFVMEEAARLLDIPVAEFSAVSCHLGSGGASLCAIVNGKSMDNTMGFSPLQGLVMSTRCGDLDPGVAMRLLFREGGDIGKLETMLNKKSGVLGLSGISADIRDVLKAENNPDGSCSRAARHDLARTESVYVGRIRRYIGAYLAVTGRPHALIFTDTIGETVPYVREKVCATLAPFGIELDTAKNASLATLPSDIASDDSAVRIMVIATNEELAIARRTCEETTIKNK